MRQGLKSFIVLFVVQRFQYYHCNLSKEFISIFQIDDEVDLYFSNTFRDALKAFWTLESGEILQALTQYFCDYISNV